MRRGARSLRPCCEMNAKRRQRCGNENATVLASTNRVCLPVAMDTPPVVFPDEMIAEILSYVDVKTLMQLRSVSKAWRTLISNPTFVNLHLQRSSRNPHLTLLLYEKDLCFGSRVLAPFPVRHLLENPSIIDGYDGVDAYCYRVKLREYTLVVGSYNGLVCFYDRHVIDDHAEYWLGFQNPVMGTRSEKLGHFSDFEQSRFGFFKFSFGYDVSTGTYKVVAFCVDGQENDEASRRWRSEVKVFNLGDNSWRKIQSFPVVPLGCLKPGLGDSEPNDGVHLVGTVNWLALSNTFISSYDWKHIPNVENFVILSLSLSTETYTQLLLPKSFNEVPPVQPTLGVLRNRLCFSHDFSGTEFVIWQMSEFGVRESWTQLIKMSYETLQIEKMMIGYKPPLLPLYLSENNDTLIFANYEEEEEDGFLVYRDNWAIIYSWKDDRVEKKKTRVSEKIDWFSTMYYVESLVSIT